MRTREVHLIERPSGMPLTSQFILVDVEVAEPRDGEVLVQNIFMSVDPAMRPRLAGQQALNQAMLGGAIGRVIKSRHAAFKEGDLVESLCGFREYFTADHNTMKRVDPDGLPLVAYMSVLGLTGLTAYGGLLIIGALKDGENVFVSAAGGAVGSVAAQIAKLKGCYVIGSAGSEEKCRWLVEELKLDAAINYRDGRLRTELKAAAPNGIDVYFDNVGGGHLDAALPRMNALGRVAVCGMISAYNNAGAVSEPVTTLSNIIYNRVNIRGFVYYEFESVREKFLGEMKAWLREGKIRYRTTIRQGIEEAAPALIGLFTGANVGKMVVQLTAE